VRVQGNTFIFHREKYQGLPVICLVHYSSLWFEAKQKHSILVYLYSENTESHLSTFKYKLMFLINPQINLSAAFVQNKPIGSIKQRKNSFQNEH